ncbi:hypothetical protein [Segatella bryantii]|jgi:hypothetical protein|uniref:hypothetical protein n=1 Tax=Segatella bryantii TaxID=77095 RepID=UPI0024322B48|nr:hypothetical protein [Segatella bryantii]
MNRQNKSNKNWSHKHDYPADEIWQTGHVIAQFIAARLRAFRSYDKHGYSRNFSSMEKWNKALDKMTYAFELYAHGTIAPEEQEAFQEGLDLFYDNFLYLWD